MGEEMRDGACAVSTGTGVDGGLAERAASSATSESVCPSAEELAAYYDGWRLEYGFASLCRMVLPAALLGGKRIIDICCRRGKGAYKLSSMAGCDGFVTGVDWDADFLEDARRSEERAWRKSGFSSSNMRFVQAYPEDLSSAGIGAQTMDVAYINNVLTLLYDQRQVLEEIGRVLVPGGLLVLETVFADKARDEDVVARARAAGNSIQAARTRAENLAWLESAGFDNVEIVEEYEVDAARGSDEDNAAEVVESRENVCFFAVALHARKA